MTRSWLVAILFVAAGSQGPSQSTGDQKSLSVRLVAGTKVALQDAFKCDAILGTQLTIEGAGIAQLLRGSAPGSTIRSLKGTIFPGTDTLNIEIEGDALHYMTGASFRLGLAKTTPLRIISRFGSSVVAVGTDESQTAFAAVTGVDLIIVDRSTGEGLWQHSKSIYPITGGPDSQSYFLKCR